jgi:A/G-specific adenine glycosylase
MLQQTQVKTMLPYFDRWMKEIPSVEALARTSEHRVLALWQGLGYYNRARQIKKAADYLLTYHGGKLPEDYETLLKVPGIGPYSAGAILSLAFNQKVPIADGNVLRVLSRVYAIRSPVNAPKTALKIRALEASLLPHRNPGEFNEGLMELGAMICTPKDPNCSACPVQSRCQAFAKGLTTKLPVKTNRVKIQKVKACAVIVEYKDKFFLHRRPEGKIMGGLWEFPEWKLEAVEGKQVISETLRLAAESLEFVSKFKRHYTRYCEELEIYRVKLCAPMKPVSPDWQSQWLKRTELAGYPLTSAHSRIRDFILGC